MKKRFLCVLLVFVLAVSSCVCITSAANVDVASSGRGRPYPVIESVEANGKLEVVFDETAGAYGYRIWVATGTSPQAPAVNSSAWVLYAPMYCPRSIIASHGYYVYGWSEDWADVTLNNMKMPVSSSTRPNRLRSTYVYVMIKALNKSNKVIGTYRYSQEFEYWEFAPYFVSGRYSDSAYATETINPMIALPVNMSKNARYLRVYYNNGSNPHVKYADVAFDDNDVTLFPSIKLCKVLHNSTVNGKVVRSAEFTCRLMDANHKACSPYISMSYAGRSIPGGNRNMIYFQQN